MYNIIIIISITIVTLCMYSIYKDNVELRELILKTDKMYNKEAVNKKNKRIDMLYRENVNLELKTQELEELIKYQQNLLSILAKRKD